MIEETTGKDDIINMEEKVSSVRLIDIHTLSSEQMDAELEKGYANMREGIVAQLSRQKSTIFIMN